MFASFALSAVLASALHVQQDAGARVYAAVADSVLLIVAQDEKGVTVATGSAFVVGDGRLVKPTASISAKPLRLSERTIPPGTTVFALGNPRGLERTISQGLFAGNRHIDGRDLLQVSASISAGSSGGPVVTADGSVIGVATFSLLEGQNLNFAVSASAVRDLLAREVAAVAPQAKPTPKLAARALAALDKAKLGYEKTADGVWKVDFEGDHFKQLDVYIQAFDEMVVVSANIAEKPPLSSDLLRQLLRASFDANHSKIALNEDGDVISLAELPADFTSEALRQAIQQVAELADFVGPLVSAPTATAKLPASALPAARGGQGAALSILNGIFELRYNPSKWREQPDDEGTLLVHHTGEANAKVIGERIEISIDALRDAALKNAKAVAPDTTLDGEVANTVNGLSTRVLRYSATVEGIKWVFMNQIYSDHAGSVQMLTWTSSNLIDEHLEDFAELFAGFRKVR